MIFRAFQSGKVCKIRFRNSNESLDSTFCEWHKRENSISFMFMNFSFFFFVIIFDLRFQAGLYIFELKEFQLVIDHDGSGCFILNLVAFCCGWSRFLFRVDKTEKSSSFDEFFNFWLFLLFFFFLVFVDQRSTCAKKKKSDVRIWFHIILTDCIQNSQCHTALRCIENQS